MSLSVWKTKRKPQDTHSLSFLLSCSFLFLSTCLVSVEHSTHLLLLVTLPCHSFMGSPGILVTLVFHWQAQCKFCIFKQLTPVTVTGWPSLFPLPISWPGHLCVLILQPLLLPLPSGSHCPHLPSCPLKEQSAKDKPRVFLLFLFLQEQSSSAAHASVYSWFCSSRRYYGTCPGFYFTPFFPLRNSLANHICLDGLHDTLFGD